MLLTVPCYPFPCFLICIKMVLPLKQRVSGLFLWLRCVSLSLALCSHRVLPGAHLSSPRSLHEMLHAVFPYPLLHSVSPGFCPLSTWVLLPLSCSVLVHLNFGTEVCCSWFLMLSPHSGEEQWRPVLCCCPCGLPAQGLLFLMCHPGFCFLFFPFVLLCGSLRICLSCFEYKFSCQLFGLKAGKKKIPPGGIKFFYKILFSS